MNIPVSSPIYLPFVILFLPFSFWEQILGSHVPMSFLCYLHTFSDKGSIYVEADMQFRLGEV